MSDDEYASLFEGAEAGPLFPEGFGAVLGEILRPKPPAEQDGPPWTHHFPARGGWGREFLGRCGIDPDDPRMVRDLYESCRTGHAEWLASGVGEMDGEAYYMLVDAIKELYGWECFPLDWPAPILVLMQRPMSKIPSCFRRTETP